MLSNGLKDCVGMDICSHMTICGDCCRYHLNLPLVSVLDSSLDYIGTSKFPVKLLYTHLASLIKINMLVSYKGITLCQIEFVPFVDNDRIYNIMNKFNSIPKKCSTVLYEDKIR